MLKTIGKQLLYELDKHCDEGDLIKSKHPSLPLNVYCYSKETQYKGKWTRITKAARGIVVHRDTGEVIAKPFEKFFNFGEKFCHPPKRGDFLAFEKLDGSLNNWFYFNNKWMCSTKCSFENDYTEYANRFSHLLRNMPKDYTVMCEIVLPGKMDGMRRVVNHDPGLYLTGLTDLQSQEDISIGMFHGTWDGLWPKIYRDKTLDELVQSANEQLGTEGWVVRYSNGYRIKIKTAWYLKVFRALCGLDKHINEDLILEKSLDEILREVPEELHEDISNYYNGVMEWVDNQEKEIKEEISKILKNLNGELDPLKLRKQFALTTINHDNRHHLFSLYDGRSIKNQLIKEAIKNGMH